MEAEELDIEALSQDNGVEVFRRWVQERYQEVEVSKIAESLTLFFRRLRREAGQSIREFNSAFDRAHTRLLEIDCRLPEVAKAWAYLNGLGLSSSEELALLGSVGNDYSTAKLQRAAVLHEKSLRIPWHARRASGGTGEGKGVRVKGAFLTDANDEDLVQDDDGTEPSNEDLIPEEAAVELHEAYVAAESAKAKYREVARARGVDPGLLSRDSKDPSKRDSHQDSGYDMRLQAAKAKSFCAGCRRRGHWHKDPECPLNAGRQQQASSSSDKNPVQNPGKGNPNMSKEAYVVQVAYEVGYMGGTGLVAITDTACSKSVMGQSWLQKYMKVAQAAGVPMQLLDCQDDFRFGASKLFRATYTATILIPLGEHGDRGFLVRASVVQGEVPLLLSRRALSTLGMLFDVERHAADFKHLNILNYQLLTTENGHPAIPVNPQALQHVRFPSPQEWADDEVRLISNTQSPCQAYTHEGCQVQDCQPVSSVSKHESALVADGGPAISTSSTSSPNLVKNDLGVYKTIFYPKKLPQIVHNFLSSETLNPDVFMSWWSETNLSKDFWIETSTSFIRVHINPRKGFFAPDQWQTPQSEVREELLRNIGDIRSTEGIACTSMKLLGTLHDLWRDAQDSAHGTLWVGRSIFPRVPPEHGHQAQVGLADEQAGAHPGSSESRSDSAYQLGEGRDKDHSHREEEGGERHFPDSTRPCVIEAHRAGGENEGVKHPSSAQTNSRADAAYHTRYDSGPERADPHLRETQGASFQRSPRILSPMEHGRSQSQRSRNVGRPPPVGQLCGDPSGEPADSGREQRPGGGSHDPIRPGLHDIEGSTEHGLFFGMVGADDRAEQGQGQDCRDVCRLQGSSEGEGHGEAPEAGSRESRQGEDEARGARGREVRVGGSPGSASRPVRGVNPPICAEGSAGETVVGLNNAEDYYESPCGGREALENIDGDHEEFFDCLESTESQIPVEFLARELLRQKDFSFASMQKVVREVCEQAKSSRKRQVAGEFAATLALGAYAHGGFYGIIKKTYEHSYVVRYINACMKFHGAQGSWTALSCSYNSRVLVHRDQHNLAHSKSQTLSFGDYTGGRLWLEASPVAQVQEHGGHPCGHDLIDKDGEKVNGFLVSTKERMFEFDPKHKHGVEEFEGERYSITCYTPRGAEHMSWQEKDVLRTFGFPVTSPIRQAPRECHASNFATEKNPRPKKSIRKQLWKSATRASALLTLGLAAATNYLSEHMPHGPLKERPCILEIGDTEMTCHLAECGNYVVEPLGLDSFGHEDSCAHVVDTIHALKPHVLWVRGDGQGCDMLPSIFSAATNQMLHGGVFVFQEDERDPIWSHQDFKDLLQGYENISEHEGGLRTVHVAKHGFLPPRMQPVYAGEAVDIPEGTDNLQASQADQPDREVAEGLPPGCHVSFDGNVPKIIQSSLSRLHQNLGHPANSDLARHLRFAGADESVIQACKKLRCQVCSRSKGPSPPRPATLPALLDFNQLVSVDVFHAFDSNKVKHEFLSVIDHATTFHLVCELEGHSSMSFERQFTQLWGNVFGPPGTIAADLETGLQAGLASYAEFHGCRLRPAAGQAHWQQGTIERHGLWYQEILRRVVDERSIDASDMFMAVQAVNSAKNELRRRHGFSPCQAVFGKDPRAPGEIGGNVDEERYLEILSQDKKRQREVAIRTSARIAFFRTSLDSKLRRSLIRRARVKKGGYAIGELVCFFRVDKAGTKSNTKRGRWRGPGTIIGGEGGNWWISYGGRCHLVAEEHMRPSTSEEIGDLFSTRVARDDLEKLLQLDPDDPETYQDPPEVPETLDQDPAQEDMCIEDDMEFSFDFPGEDFDGDGEDTSAQQGTSAFSKERRGLGPHAHAPVTKRHRKKGPVEQSVNMLKRCHTVRSLEKQYEKELPWSIIPESQHGAFRQAELKQYHEHLHYQALEPLSIAESNQVRQSVHPSRILGSRFAYRDKNWSRRKLLPELPWRHKARLVISGHMDPDIGSLETDAPTINRLSVMTLLQLVASRRKSHGWEASAGDITAAFLNGDRLEREIYLKQPRTGLGDLDPRQLLRVVKGVFGLPDSPRKWWKRLRKDMLNLKIHLDSQDFCFTQSPLDPCLFQLVPVEQPNSEPVAYVGVHVDDLLVVGSKRVSQAVRDALSACFPVDDWEINSFDYIGSHIEVTDEGVLVDQEAYAASRLFQVEISKDQHDEDAATEDQRIDNQSLVGALSWLGSQSRPDLQCSVSLAQQLQKEPTVADIKFTNQTAKRAWEHRDKGIWLRPLDLTSLEFLVFHDSAWANAELTGEDGFRLSYEDHIGGTMTGTPFDLKARKAKRANSKVASQYGILIYLTDKHAYAQGGGIGSVLDWKSTANPRVCRSTFGAETTACSEAIELGQYVRSFVQTVLTGRLQRVEGLCGKQLRCITDCKSLYDHLHKEGVPRIPSDKRLAIDLAALRQYFKEEQQDERAPLYWVPTGYQLADILTKPRNADEWWSAVWGGVRLPFVKN